jgi:hypothetical protein
MTLGLAVLASASVTWSVSPRAAIQTELRFGRTTPLVLLYPTGGPSGLSHRALNSAVECHLHTVEVVGSNPTAPTIAFNGLVRLAPCLVSPLRFQSHSNPVLPQPSSHPSTCGFP